MSYHTDRPDPLIVRGLRRRVQLALAASPTCTVVATRPLVVDGRTVLAVERRSEVDVVVEELIAAGRVATVGEASTPPGIPLVSCLGAEPVDVAWAITVS